MADEIKKESQEQETQNQETQNQETQNQDLENQDLLLEKKEKEEPEENLEDVLKDYFGVEETEEPENEVETKPEIKEEIKEPKKVELTPEEVEKLVEKKAREIATAKIQETFMQEKIQQDINEFRKSGDKEKEKIVVEFLKNNPDLSDGIIREAYKKRKNPLTEIYNFAIILKEKNEKFETPPEISGKGGAVGKGEVSPEQALLNEIKNAGKSENPEQEKARQILT